MWKWWVCCGFTTPSCRIDLEDLKKDENQLNQFHLLPIQALLLLMPMILAMTKFLKGKLRLYAKKNDVLIGISTSGESISVLKAVEEAAEINWY